MSEELDRREYTRFATSLSIEVTSADGQPIEGRTVDFSTLGFRFDTANPLPVNAICRIRMIFDKGGEEAPIEAEGVVVHSEPSGMGVRLTGLAEECQEDYQDVVALHSTATP